MSHLTDDNRKTISNMISHKATRKEIADRIGCDPTTISKEIKKNRVISKEAKGDKKILCRRLEIHPKEKMPYIGKNFYIRVLRLSGVGL